ncbi:hypothetical protein FOMPIDRAFT_149065, partial [Fomitopsis schrenkii]
HLSFPASPRAAVLPWSPRDFLALAFSQGLLDELPILLARAAYDPNTSAQGVAQVIASLERVGVDFSSTRAVIAGNGTVHHCARCHKLFRDQENGPSTCVIYHEASDARWELSEYDASCSCPCRGIRSTLNSHTTVEAECYRGWHTDDRAQVDYVSSSAIPCADNHCTCVPSALLHAISSPSSRR